MTSRGSRRRPLSGNELKERGRREAPLLFVSVLPSSAWVLEGGGSGSQVQVRDYVASLSSLAKLSGTLDIYLMNIINDMDDENSRSEEVLFQSGTFLGPIVSGAVVLESKNYCRDTLCSCDTVLHGAADF